MAVLMLLAVLSGCIAPMPPVQAPAVDIGAPGVGDRLYPDLGNGGYDVRHYEIVMDVDVEQNEIDALATIDAVTTQPLRRFNLDLVGLEVTLLTVDGVEAVFVRDGSELIITPAQPLAAGEPFEVAVSYRGEPTPLSDDSVGIDTLGWQLQPGGIFAASEPSGSMNWYPSNNHPSDKATYTFTITVPAEYEVGMNGVLADQTSGALDGQPATTYVWDVVHPMATYLATIHIGAYDVETEETVQGVLLRNYFPAETPASVRSDFDSTAEMLDYMVEAIAPYPFDVYGAVLLTQNVPWALETQTLSIFPVGGADERTVMHELAHQWFGNDVSPAMWEDIWLNEGFASYFHFLWLTVREDEATFTTVMDNLYDQLVRAEAGPPIPETPRDLFSRSVYFRGAWTLHALRLTLADDEMFFDILRTYYARHAGGNASTDDFIAVVEELSDPEALAVVREWLYAPNVPPHPARTEVVRAPATPD
jgi:aminopeptidase N